jgi:hypothetical protein
MSANQDSPSRSSYSMIDLSIERLINDHLGFTIPVCRVLSLSAIRDVYIDSPLYVPESIKAHYTYEGKYFVSFVLWDSSSVRFAIGDLHFLMVNLGISVRVSVSSEKVKFVVQTLERDEVISSQASSEVSGVERVSAALECGRHLLIAMS